MIRRHALAQIGAAFWIAVSGIAAQRPKKKVIKWLLLTNQTGVVTRNIPTSSSGNWMACQERFVPVVQRTSDGKIKLWRRSMEELEKEGYVEYPPTNRTQRSGGGGGVLTD